MGLSVERVGAVGSVDSTPYVSTVQNSYAIKNYSDISGAFVDSIKGSSSTGGVQAAPPVQYANAKNIRIGSTEKAEETQKVSQAFNSLAKAFSGANTSYGADSVGTAYSVVGGGFDAFA